MFLNRAGVQNAYSHRTRIGNWNEEQQMEELRMKDFIRRKESGSLLVHQIQRHMSSSLTEVPLSFSPDGVVRVGDSVMLYGVDSEGVLSADPADRVAGGGERAFAATSSTLVKAHVARNVFVIEAYGSDVAPGSPLKLGQLFRLRAHPRLLLPDQSPYYLHSQPVSSLAASKVSRKQLVCFSPARTYDSVWRAAWKDINRRFEMDGAPVPANCEVILLHAATNTPLASTRSAVYHNDFGAESEVCAHSFMDVRKSQGLYAELQGRTTTDVPFRKESAPNHWAFLTAASPDMEAGLAEANAAASSSSGAAGALTHVLANVREDLLSRGPEHMLSLLRSARLSDPRRSGVMSTESFRKLLLAHGVSLRLEEFEGLVRVLDDSGMGAGVGGGVAYDRFLRALHGDSPPLHPSERQAIVDVAWNSLDSFGAGSVPLALLRERYDPAADPDVKLGRRGAAAALDLMTTKLGSLCVGGRLSRDDWNHFYAIVSTYTQSDDYFVALVGDTWRLKGAAAGANAPAASATFARTQQRAL